jgi:hypothetical protein
VFWQRQPKLPLPVLKFLGARVEAALAAPADRALLVWPLVLGAPALREAHPDGLPEPELLARAAAMLGPLGLTGPGELWADALARLPNTADRGPGGWVPHRIWEPMSALVSLRLGVALLAMLGQPEDGRYGLACGIALFNCALFHECHDALEPLWLGAEGRLKAGLQGLILLAGGFHHLQLHNPGGMIGLWGDALAALEPFAGELPTPWGAVAFAPALAAAAERLAWLDHFDGDMELDPLWAMPRPVLELT